MQIFIDKPTSRKEMEAMLNGPFIRRTSSRQRTDLFEGCSPTKMEMVDASRLVSNLLDDARDILEAGLPDLSVVFFKAACKTVTRITPGMNLRILNQLNDCGLNLALQLRQSSHDEQTLAVLDTLIVAKRVVADSISSSIASSISPPKSV